MNQVRTFLSCSLLSTGCLEIKELDFVGHWFVSTDTCREFTTDSTSVIRVWRDSSFKHLPWFFNSNAKILLADLIWRSHTPLTWLAAGAILDQISQSVPVFAWKWWICCWFISLKTFFNSFLATTKFVSLSDFIPLTLSCLAINRLSVGIN